MDQQHRPIGYWLKHVDRLLEEAFERTLRADGLTRRHWQVLSVLDRGPATRADLSALLQPFVAGDPDAIERVLADLASRGWLRRMDPGGLELSEDGRSAHAIVTQRVMATRQLLRRGITDEEYRGLVKILERMAANLESDGA